MTLVKVPKDGITRCHVRFRGGITEILVANNPKSSAQQVKTPSEIVDLVDRLLDDYTCSEIAEILNEKGLHPGGSARKERKDDIFTVKKVNYLMHRYNLRMRYDRLRNRGYLDGKEMAKKLGIHEHTVVSWATVGILKKHAYNDHYFLYESPDPNTPPKYSSRWNTLIERVIKIEPNTKSCPGNEGDAV